MSSEAVRIESETLNALRERSAQSGEPIVRLAQRHISEGMQLDRHPGIFFRDGRAGRRAVVIGGPDVWELIAAARSAPERGEQLVRALAERIGIPVEKVRSAIRTAVADDRAPVSETFGTSDSSRRLRSHAANPRLA